MTREWRDRYEEIAWVLCEMRHVHSHHDMPTSLPWFVLDKDGVEHSTKDIPQRVDYVAFGADNPRIVFAIDSIKRSPVPTVKVS